MSNDHKPVNKGMERQGQNGCDSMNCVFRFQKDSIRVTAHVANYFLITFFVGESRRIVAAGGFVEYGRINGSLALSRALGDFEFKMNATLGPDDQIVTGMFWSFWFWIRY